MRRPLARAGVLLCVCLLVCVPALTRIGQKLQPVTPISSAPSFAKNIDCPPRKVTIAPVVAITSVVLHEEDESVPVARLQPSPDATIPHPPTSAAPSPLRAPPVTFFV